LVAEKKVIGLAASTHSLHDFQTDGASPGLEISAGTRFRIHHATRDFKTGAGFLNEFLIEERVVPAKGVIHMDDEKFDGVGIQSAKRVE